ncbi:hypothetical protein ACN09X_04810 [Aliarcobacter butzleri]|uniref:hypothetical protein n=1 Tax=Aliarcobacter butzleri TaxID=28197 RepID=UPI003AD81FB9
MKQNDLLNIEISLEGIRILHNVVNKKSNMNEYRHFVDIEKKSININCLKIPEIDDYKQLHGIENYGEITPSHLFSFLRQKYNVNLKE